MQAKDEKDKEKEKERDKERDKLQHSASRKEKVVPNSASHHLTFREIRLPHN